MGDRKFNRSWIAVAILGLIIGFSGGYAWNYQRDRANQAEVGEAVAEQATADIAGPAEEQSRTVRELCEGEDDLARELQTSGACEDAAETQDAIEQAPARIIQGRPGPQGLRGPGPTSIQVLDAVIQALPDALEAACGGSCVGDPGADGADSTVPGPAGPAGPPGPAGGDGRDAPRIAEVFCDGSTGVIVLDDASTYRVDDMCFGPLIPAPEETP